MGTKCLVIGKINKYRVALLEHLGYELVYAPMPTDATGISYTATFIDEVADINPSAYDSITSPSTSE